MQDSRAGRLVFLDFVLFFGREVGGLAVGGSGHGVGTVGVVFTYDPGGSWLFSGQMILR
ncbi:hypothetical protein D3C72_1855150 [compost metagenome]